MAPVGQPERIAVGRVGAVVEEMEGRGHGGAATTVCHCFRDPVPVLVVVIRRTLHEVVPEVLRLHIWIGGFPEVAAGNIVLRADPSGKSRAADAMDGDLGGIDGAHDAAFDAGVFRRQDAGIDI